MGLEGYFSGAVLFNVLLCLCSLLLGLPLRISLLGVEPNNAQADDQRNYHQRQEVPQGLPSDAANNESPPE